jgi:hypothetical protein
MNLRREFLMSVKFSIPTLQEYAKKRKREMLDFQEVSNCESCEFCKSSLGACIWGENVRVISMLKACPLSGAPLY